MQNNLRIGISDRIKSIKDDVGGVAVLERKTGISQSYLSRLMNGVVKNPTVEKIMKIAEAGDVSVEFLLTGKSSDDRVACPVHDIEGGHSVYLDNCILDRVDVSVEQLRVYSYSGDTMNLYSKGDLLLINISDLSGDGIYLVDFGGGISVRRVTWLPNGMVKVISDNYGDHEVKADDLSLLGKVLWAGISQ